VKQNWEITSTRKKSTGVGHQSFPLSGSLPLPIDHPHHLHELLLGDYTFLHKQPGEGFSMDYLGHEEFFKGDELFVVEGVAIGVPDLHALHKDGMTLWYY